MFENDQAGSQAPELTHAQGRSLKGPAPCKRRPGLCYFAAPVGFYCCGLFLLLGGRVDLLDLVLLSQDHGDALVQPFRRQVEDRVLPSSRRRPPFSTISAIGFASYISRRRPPGS